MLEIEIAPVGRSDGSALASVAALYRRSKSTLGFLPEGAFTEAASRGTLCVGRLDGTVVAYALYRMTAARIRLTHLCVDQSHRNRGVGRALVDWISVRHADYPGILVRCRHDYNLGPMWSGLGFTQLSEAPGRSKEGHALVYWWLDHGHPTLFSRHLDSALLRAAVDFNILRDLHDPTRAGADESLALVSDQFSDQIELIRTAALDVELDSLDGDLRPALTVEAQRLTQIRSDTSRTDEARTALTRIAESSDTKFAASDAGRRDIQHVAAAAGAGITVFVTRDRHLARVLGATAADYGVRILAPADVVIHVDELTRADAYRPAALLQTSLTRRRLGSADDAAIVGALRNVATREKPRDLLSRLHKIAGQKFNRWGIFGEAGELLAGYVHAVEAGQLSVSLLRTAEHPMADTFARQLLFLLRQEAREQGSPIVSLLDSHLSEPVRVAAISDGFYKTDSHYCAFVLSTWGTAAEIERQAIAAARRVGSPDPASLSPGMPAIAAAEVERAWWPARVTDSQLPSYLVPIRHGFSAQLLGVPAGLLPRSEVLGLSREHVYFRSPQGSRPHAPSRLLWYMSRKGAPSQFAAGIVACSQLESVSEGTPDELHERYRHLGVWELPQIRAASRKGRAQALRFINTEVFPRPVPLDRVREVARVPLRPTLISADQFEMLYGEGRGS